MKDKIVFEIKETIGIISKNTSGWKKELNLISWNGEEPKFDIREWNSNHTYMSRGITFSKNEFKKFCDAIKSLDEIPDLKNMQAEQPIKGELDEGFVYEIYRIVAVLGEYCSGWKKEFTITAWNESTPKFDVRDWSPNHKNMSRGLQLFSDEMRTLKSIIENIDTDQQNEFIGQIIDIFEDFLEEKQICIKNNEREDLDDAIIYGSDYGILQTELEKLLHNWNIKV